MAVDQPHRFPVDELLGMAPISVRHPDIHTSYRVINGADSGERESHWEVDPISGAKCPPPAGEITPILDLPPFHPARWYLEAYRKFDLQRLTDMFRCGFCSKEYKEGLHKIWYRKFPGGWKDTPQGRIIFHSLHNGTPLTWQALMDLGGAVGMAFEPTGDGGFEGIELGGAFGGVAAREGGERGVFGGGFGVDAEFAADLVEAQAMLLMEEPDHHRDKSHQQSGLQNPGILQRMRDH